MRPAESLLAQTELFGRLRPEVVADIATRSLRRSYKKGAFIFSQGDPGESLFVLLDGLVKVVVGSELGDEMVLETLGPPATFGELALVDAGPRSASVEVVSPATVLVLTRGIFDELCQRHPSLREGLLVSLAGVLRRLTAQASDLVFLDLEGRVAKLLCSFADRGAQQEGEIVLDLALTQGELAQMVGGSRQSVNQILRSLEHRGLLELSRQRIVLKRLDLLRQRGGS
jgi:CRP/FNR family transcriptional regulator, cyclic AMP receptor protein